MKTPFPPFELMEPLLWKSMSVFPISTTETCMVDYLLSFEAIEAGTLTIREIDHAGAVHAVRVENSGADHVLFIEGEELIGCKQNRIVNTSLLFPPRTTAQIPVSCAEQGRWAFRSPGSGHLTLAEKA